MPRQKTKSIAHISNRFSYCSNTYSFMNVRERIDDHFRYNATRDACGQCGSIEHGPVARKASRLEHHATLHIVYGDRTAAGQQQLHYLLHRNGPDGELFRNGCRLEARGARPPPRPRCPFPPVSLPPSLITVSVTDRCPVPHSTPWACCPCCCRVCHPENSTPSSKHRSGSCP